MKLDKWQQEVLETPGNICLCSGRQTGKSTIIALKTAEYLIKNKNKTVIIVSITEDQAELMIMKILDYLQKHYRAYIAKGKKKPTKHLIRINNGSQVRSRPVGNTGDAIRGFTGDLLIADEAAFMPETMWAAAKPTLLTTAGHIILVSTPHGRQGYFWEAFQNKAKRFKVFHVNSEQVVKDRPICESWTVPQRQGAIEFLEAEKQDMSQLRYAQEYEGRFVDDLRQFFPDELIQKCMNNKRREVFQTGRDYYLGVDVARMGKDETTFEIIERVNDKSLLHVESMVTKRTYLNETTNKIIELNKRYDFRKIYIDDGGIGVGVFDYLLHEESTKRKVEAINNRSRPLTRDEKRKKKLLKEDLYNNLLGLMERGEISLLQDDSIFQSFKSVQYEYQEAGKVEIFGNYTHIVEGLIRAAWCYREKSLSIWIDGI